MSTIDSAETCWRTGAILSPLLFAAVVSIAEAAPPAAPQMRSCISDDPLYTALANRRTTLKSPESEINDVMNRYSGLLRKRGRGMNANEEAVLNEWLSGKGPYRTTPQPEAHPNLTGEASQTPHKHIESVGNEPDCFRAHPDTGKWVRNRIGTGGRGGGSHIPYDSSFDPEVPWQEIPEPEGPIEVPGLSSLPKGSSLSAKGMLPGSPVDKGFGIVGTGLAAIAGALIGKDNADFVDEMGEDGGNWLIWQEAAISLYTGLDLLFGGGVVTDSHERYKKAMREQKYGTGPCDRGNWIGNPDDKSPYFDSSGLRDIRYIWAQNRDKFLALAAQGLRVTHPGLTLQEAQAGAEGQSLQMEMLRNFKHGSLPTEED